MSKINSQHTAAEKAAPDYYEKWLERARGKGGVERPLTTDDCFTPEAVYEAVLDWAKHEYGIGPDTRILRPFWPDGDYQQEDYGGDCVVIDNPPFSIISQIVRWYEARGVKYFLFAPGMMLFSVIKSHADVGCVIIHGSIEYLNGAKVATGFVTNLSDARVHVSPQLSRAVREAQKQGRPNNAQTARKRIAWPDEIISAATLKMIAPYTELKIGRDECARITKPDNTKTEIFGGGMLVSERIAARVKAARAEAAAKGAEHIELSEREREIVRRLSAKDGPRQDTK